jgi:hypothetical protein
MAMGVLTVGICNVSLKVLADNIADNEFVQLMMQK